MGGCIVKVKVRGSSSIHYSLALSSLFPLFFQLPLPSSTFVLPVPFTMSSHSPSPSSYFSLSATSSSLLVPISAIDYAQFL